MKELNKLINKIMLWNLPCVAYLYYIILDPIDFETMMYRSNFVILGFGIMNWLLFISELYKELKKNKLSVKNILLANFVQVVVFVIPMLYYAVSPLLLYRAIDGADKNVNTVIFSKKEFPDLADNSFVTCKDELVCYFRVVKFRVYPTHGLTADVDISPDKYMTISLTMPIKNVHIVFDQVILGKENR